jgi:uncharacterized protein (TIGR02246 family)
MQGNGQDPQGRQDAPIRAVIAKFAEARNRHDLPTLVALYADDAEWISQNGGFNRGRQALLTMWSRQVQTVDHVDRTISQIDQPSANIAVVHVSGQYPPPLGVHEEVFILVKENENWKIRIHQIIR